MNDKDILREGLRRLGMRQTDFAGVACVTDQFVSSVINGKAPMPEPVRTILSRLLDEAAIPDMIRSPDEAAILYGYRELSPEGKSAVSGMITALCKVGVK